MSDDVKTPYDGEELMELARKEAGKLKLPRSRREDAEMEYVLAALEALKKDDQPGDIRAFQRRCGHDAMIDFLRREIRHERLSPPFCSRKAERDSLDRLVPGGDGVPVALAETVPDHRGETPETILLQAERDEAVREAMRRLRPEIAAVAVKILVESMTQEEAAEALGMTRDMVRTRLDAAKRQLQEALSAYRDEFTGMRRGEK